MLTKKIVLMIFSIFLTVGVFVGCSVDGSSDDSTVENPKGNGGDSTSDSMITVRNDWVWGTLLEENSYIVYKFTANTDTIYQVRVTDKNYNTYNTFSSLVYISAYTEAHKVEYFTNDSTTPSEEINIWSKTIIPTSTGAIYIKLTPKDSSSTGNYSLQVQEVSKRTTTNGSTSWTKLNTPITVTLSYSESYGYSTEWKNTSGGDNTEIITVPIKQFFWGTWQCMADGTTYMVDDRQVVVYDSDGLQKGTYKPLSCTDTTLSVNGTYFVKETDRIIKAGDIPYFRNGGTNLKYTFEVVGFESSGSRAMIGTDKKLEKAMLKSETIESHIEWVEPDANGILNCTASIAGEKFSGQGFDASGNELTSIPSYVVENDGSNMGKIIIPSEGNYMLKVTGGVADENKTGGYLYGDNFTTYPLTITITNTSNILCSACEYDISVDEGFVTLSGTSLHGVLQSIPKSGKKDIELTVTCGQFSGAYADVKINVTLNNMTGTTWKDFITLRFYKGVIPITVAAAGGDNQVSSQAKLNGFVIYPNDKGQYFSVSNNGSTTLYVPSNFDKSYTLAFSGAFVTETNGTEMFYTVAPASKTKKAITKEGVSVMQFGGNNHSELDAFAADGAFEAYLASGEIDYFTLSFNESDIINAREMPKSYWSDSQGSSDGDTVTPSEDLSKTVKYVTNADGERWYTGSLSSSTGYVVYRFYATKDVTYSINICDSLNTAVEGCTGRIYVSASKSSTDFTSSSNTYFTANYTSSGYKSCYTTIKPASSGNVYLKVYPQSYSGTGTFAISVHKESSTTYSYLYFNSSSNYNAWDSTWVSGKFSTGSSSATYCFWASPNKDYTIKWADKEEGTGQTADIKVSASTNATDFSSGMYTFFTDADHGYNIGQTVCTDAEGYVFINVKPYNSTENYKGTYSINVTDSLGKVQEILIYNNSFTTKKGEDITKRACDIIKDGYFLFSFPALKGNEYSVAWNSADEGLGMYTASIAVSVSDSEDMSNPYWTYETGYTTARTVIPKNSGTMYIKVVQKDKLRYGDFSLGIANGKKEILLKQYDSKNAISAYYTGADVPKNAWVKGSISSANAEKVYCFKRNPYTLYRIFVDDKADGSGGYNGKVQLYGSTSNAEDSTAKILDGAYSEGYNFCRSITDDDMYYLHIAAYEKSSENTGTFAISVLDGNNEPVPLTQYVTSSDVPSSAWRWGYILQDGYEVFSFPAKKNSTYSIFWDDGKDGSVTEEGRYIYGADITLSAYADENLTSLYWSEKNGYSEVHSVTPKEDGYVYVKIEQDTTTKGNFMAAVLNGTNVVTMTENKASRCNFYAETAQKIPESAWKKGEITKETLVDVYYFKLKPGNMYKVYVDSGLWNQTIEPEWTASGYSSGKYTGCFRIKYSIDLNFEGDTLGALYPLQLTLEDGGTYWLELTPYTKFLGTYAIAVVDCDYNPVDLNEYAVDSWELPPASVSRSEWLKGNLSTSESIDVYRFILPANTSVTVFWDDVKKDSDYYANNSGENNANLKVGLNTSEEYFVKEQTFNHSENPWFYSVVDDKDSVGYLYVSPIDDSPESLGSYSVALFVGNEMIPLTKVTPNSEIQISMASDINVTHATVDTIQTFTADPGYMVYNWYVDGVKQKVTENVFSVDTAMWKKGSYEIVLEASKGAIWKSSTIFVKITGGNL